MTWELAWYVVLGLFLLGSIENLKDQSLKTEEKVGLFAFTMLAIVVTAAVKLDVFSGSPAAESTVVEVDNSPEGIAKAIYLKRGDIIPTVVSTGDGSIKVTATTSNFLTAYFLRLRTLDNAARYFQRVFPSNAGVDRVEIEHRATLVDVRGHESLQPVMRITMRRKSASGINWSNFDHENFAIVADSYWEHPAFNR